MLSSGDNAENSSKDLIELRSRSNRSYRDEVPRNPGDKVLIEKKLKPGDSLNKIALQYSVPVSEIKRVNGIVADQEIYALPSVKIPISRLRKELDLEHERELLKNDSSVTDSDLENDCDEGRRLLPEKNGRVYKSVEELFKNADASVSQVRDNLANASTTDGAFHFVDASAPGHNYKGMWTFIIIVLTLFVIIPLLLTYFEESSEAKEEHFTHRAKSQGLSDR